MRILATALLPFVVGACATAQPPEARSNFIMGATFMKEAKSPLDFERAVTSFRLALQNSPDWLDARYNLAVALESLKRYSEAKSEYTAYIVGKPPKKDADEARDRIYALEAKMEMERSPEFRKALDEAVKRAAEAAKKEKSVAPQ